MEKGSRDTDARQGGMSEGDRQELAREVGEKCFGFLRPLLRQLDAHLDCRLVRTLANLVPLPIRRRNRASALLLSELGDELGGEEHGPAGTKRIANPLRSERWEAAEVAPFLSGRAKEVAIAEAARAKEVAIAEAARVKEGRALVILDGSVQEKPESTRLAGLAPVLSARARRLRRPRPKLGRGYWRGKPGPPTVVPGFSWLGVLVTGWAGREARRPVALGGWRWYRRVAQDHPDRDALAAPLPTASQAVAARALLRAAVEAIGAARLLFVGDREYANAPWLDTLVEEGVPFVVRWRKGNHLRPEDAPSVGDPLASPTQCQAEGRAAWRLGQKPLFRQTRTIANPRDPKSPIPVTFGARPVRPVGSDTPLWLVVVRVGKGGRRRRPGEPWRLVTNLPLETYEDAWRVVEAYAARWQIEQMLRFSKAELGVESVRVRDWEPRAKLLAILSLAYACLVQLLGDGSSPLVAQVLRLIRRTGRQANDTWRPLYRFRQALASLFKRHTPSFQGVP